MAWPFGGHPTIEDFVEWARSKGCVVDVKVRAHMETGEPYESLEFRNPQGGAAVFVNPGKGERLAPSEVAYLSRRLGMRSPFAETPEASDPATATYVDERGKPIK